MKCRTTVLVEIGFDKWTKFCQSSLLLFLWSMVVQFELYTSRQFGNYRSFMWFHHQTVVQQGNPNPPQVPFIHRGDFNKIPASHPMHISGFFGPSRNGRQTPNPARIYRFPKFHCHKKKLMSQKSPLKINQKTPPGSFISGEIFRWVGIRRCFLIGPMGLIFHRSCGAAGFHGLSSAAACCVSLVALWA